MVWKNCYKWSRDYSRLKAMLDDGFEVICWIDYEFTSSEHRYRDLCYCRKHPEGTYRFTVSGLEYGDICAKDLYSDDAFAEICSKWNIEFIDNPYYYA